MSFNACSQLQQEIHEKLLASSSTMQELDSNARQLKSLHHHNQGMVDSKV